MTERLYYHDSYLKEFRARIAAASPDRTRIYLDRTAFYPTSGGQPFDLGTLGGVPVKEVVDEEDRVAHVLAAPLDDGEVTGAIDWTRRFDHMQQHTGQHLLSAVLLKVLDAPTVSFHLGADYSTIDIARAALDLFPSGASPRPTLAIEDKQFRLDIGQRFYAALRHMERHAGIAAANHVDDIRAITPMHVAAYIEKHPGSPPGDSLASPSKAAELPTCNNSY